MLLIIKMQWSSLDSYYFVNFFITVELLHPAILLAKNAFGEINLEDVIQKTSPWIDL